MASLTLKGIPEDVMERLRDLARQERRSLNQQAILILQQGLTLSRPGFAEVYDPFVAELGPSPLDDEDLADLRSTEAGRAVDLKGRD